MSLSKCVLVYDENIKKFHTLNLLSQINIEGFDWLIKIIFYLKHPVDNLTISLWNYTFLNSVLKIKNLTIQLIKQMIDNKYDLINYHHT